MDLSFESDSILVIKDTSPFVNLRVRPKEIFTNENIQNILFWNDSRRLFLPGRVLQNEVDTFDQEVLFILAATSLDSKFTNLGASKCEFLEWSGSGKPES